MRYPNILEATFVRRRNRFVAEVSIDGTTELVHVKNTGRLEGLLVPGGRVYLFAPGTPNRKTAYDLVAARNGDGRLFNVDSQATNAVIKEWLGELGLELVVPEHRYRSSRIDFYLERQTGTGTSRTLMEVKGCTLVRDGKGLFPDAPTARGTRHLQELMNAAAAGYQAIVAFVPGTEGVTEVVAHADIDPAFARALEEARHAGVTVLTLPCCVEPDAFCVLPGVTLPA